jgi:CRP/FNR family transcriptional regulator
LLRELISQKLQAEREHLNIVATSPANERLKSFLVSMARAAVRRGERGDLISLPMPRADIAAYLSTAPETLSRAFKQSNNDGSIEIKSARMIRIKDQNLRSQIAAEPPPSPEKLRTKPGELLYDTVLASLR